MNSNDGGNLNQESTSKDAISIRENELLQERIADQAEQIEVI